ncbi:helix-turn-helix domain-containing protein [Xenorhabdus bovienii]|uniref:helix-turn-helix domain-containing protein n=1 Tax=Xenorhabdus bovienii TaxID=40576 RepID=UPI00237D2FA2|nr:helix-turn-helix domain-containing protein [Xenorhabdus bovienii]MDE1493104.1 helix-turn-helix domain-containing protein [Xenorhabdus bovienii]
MQFDENFPKRLVSARNTVGLTQVNLASKAETVVRQIAAYEAGDARPRLKTLKKIASALGTTEEWLCVGIGEAPNAESFSRIRNINQIPILHEFSIDDFVSNGHTPQGTTLYPCEADVSEKAFAFIIYGDAMTAGSGNLSLPDETIVTIDPCANFSNGGIALISQDELVRVKKVVIENNRATIISLNTSEYPSELCDLSDLDYIYPIIKAEINLGDKPPYITQWESQKHAITKSMLLTNDKNELKEQLNRIESMLEQLLNKKAP